MHPFGNVVCRISIPGRIVLAALEHGLSALPLADGGYPQVSGITLRVDAGAPPGSRARDVIVNGDPIDANREYTLAIPNFLLDGGDGYDMFKGQRIAIGPESGPMVHAAIERFISGREIAPVVEGRTAR
jgi:2',3'-cyclic-nucleotide 2'-phosphodiesterase (5'-nucleotidase family)